MLEGATSELCRGLWTIVHCAKLCRVRAAWECRLHRAGWHNNSDLNRVDLSIWGPCRSESTARSLTPLISWSRRSCWSVALPRTTALHWSQHRIMKTSFAVCRGSKWWTHWTYFSLSLMWNYCCHRRCFEIFPGVGLTARLSLQIASFDQTCWYTWRPLASRFHWDKIGIAPLVALCSLCIPKLLNFVDAFNCYSKNESWPRLIWPICIKYSSINIKRKLEKPRLLRSLIYIIRGT